MTDTERLAAAAPDLLAACKAASYMCARVSEYEDEMPELVDQLRAAIRKAEGKE